MRTLWKRKSTRALASISRESQGTWTLVIEPYGKVLSLRPGYQAEVTYDPREAFEVVVNPSNVELWGNVKSVRELGCANDAQSLFDLAS